MFSSSFWGGWGASSRSAVGPRESIAVTSSSPLTQHMERPRPRVPAAEMPQQCIPMPCSIHCLTVRSIHTNLWGRRGVCIAGHSCRGHLPARRARSSQPSSQLRGSVSGQLVRAKGLVGKKKESKADTGKCDIRFLPAPARISITASRRVRPLSSIRLRYKPPHERTND